MIEDLRAQETFITNINLELLLCYIVNAIVNFNVVLKIIVVFGELFLDIWTDITILFL